MSAPAETPAASRPTRSLRSRLPDETGVLVALLVLVVFIGMLRPGSCSPSPCSSSWRTASFTGMLALGMVFVVVIRDIDLSIGWMFNLSAIIAAKAMVMGSIRSSPPSIGIVFGGLLGLVNGVLAVGPAHPGRSSSRSARCPRIAASRWS